MALAACSGGSPPPATDSGLTTTPSVPTVELTYRAYQVDDRCWAIETADRPAELWQDYLDFCHGGGGENDEAVFVSTVDGTCIVLYELDSGKDTCMVDDPDWLRPCEDVPGCCDHGPYFGPQCPMSGR
jgi:hypothetical protein